MFDINVKLGHWPHRPVRGLDALLRYMDSNDVSGAAVSSLSSVNYLNPQDGNDELAKLIAPHRDRLVLLAVIRPDFTGWRDDFMRCVDEYGARGVVLYPNYHRYALADGLVTPLAALAAQHLLPVFIQAGLEDARRQFDRPIMLDVLAPEMGAFAKAHPDTTVVALGLKFGQPESAADPLPDNFYFDTSNYETMGELETAVEKFGPGKILFGTNFPLFTPLANVNKLRMADISSPDSQAIGEINARRLLGTCGG